MLSCAIRPRQLTKRFTSLLKFRFEFSPSKFAACKQSLEKKYIFASSHTSSFTSSAFDGFPNRHRSKRLALRPVPYESGRILFPAAWQDFGSESVFFSKSCPENKSCRSGLRNPSRKNSARIFWSSQQDFPTRTAGDKGPAKT